MARVLTKANAKKLGLLGRTSFEIVSGEAGARGVTLRLVEIPPGESKRGPHLHRDFEECIYVLAGEGTTVAESGEHPLKAGETILIAPGEKHMTRNTGRETLVLLCFFPVPDIRPGTEEFPNW
jgi:quercetin dioxygenase-like cupin family protein